MIQVVPLSGLPEISPRDDVAALIAKTCETEGLTLQKHDIIVVTQKIISKSEDRFLSLAEVEPSDKAAEIAHITKKNSRLVELVLRESIAIVRAVPNVLITRHRLGFVMANAGIDSSNTGNSVSDRVLLLPCDPDLSAKRLGKSIGRLTGIEPAIIIADSSGRPWRIGTVNLAIGAYRFPSIYDQCGQPDRDGRLLETTQPALADMVAAAAGLVLGEAAEGIPAALVRGYNFESTFQPASALIRQPEEDLFR